MWEYKEKTALCRVRVHALSLQLCLTLSNPMDCSLPGSSVHGVFTARILEWVAMLSSRGSSWPRDQTWVFCIVARFFTTEPLEKPRAGREPSPKTQPCLHSDPTFLASRTLRNEWLLSLRLWYSVTATQTKTSFFSECVNLIHLHALPLFFSEKLTSSPAPGPCWLRPLSISQFCHFPIVVIFVRSVSVTQDIQLGATMDTCSLLLDMNKNFVILIVSDRHFMTHYCKIQHCRWQKKGENGTLMTVLRCPISGSSWCESENSLYHLRQFQLGFLILTCRDMAHWETIKWVYAREWFALVPFFKKGYSRLRKQIYWLTKEKLDQEESCRSDCSCLCERL